MFLYLPEIYYQKIKESIRSKGFNITNDEIESIVNKSFKYDNLIIKNCIIKEYKEPIFVNNNIIICKNKLEYKSQIKSNIAKLQFPNGSKNDCYNILKCKAAYDYIENSIFKDEIVTRCAFEEEIKDNTYKSKFENKTKNLNNYINNHASTSSYNTTDYKAMKIKIGENLIKCI